jgi:hypothetical protein
VVGADQPDRTVGRRDTSADLPDQQRPAAYGQGCLQLLCDRHGTRAAGAGNGNTNSKGNAVVQTFAWASWLQPGIYARPNGGTYWALQEIHALSHEIAEWADDPFANNTVEPWLTRTAPQYGCTGVLETGDPVVAIGFAMGANASQQGPNPNGTQSADGYYHPEDEALLPWFMRTAPNTVSEPTQSASANVGRYTFMGNLNPFSGFRQPATGLLGRAPCA